MKHIVVDLARMTHHISTKGTFAVAECAASGDILWFRRPMVAHPRYCELEVVMSAERGLQVCRYRPHSGTDWFSLYIDIVQVQPGTDVWTADDLYADVLLAEGRRYEVLDLDELVQAHADQTVSTEQFAYAVNRLGALCKTLNQNRATLGWLSATPFRRPLPAEAKA